MRVEKYPIRIIEGNSFTLSIELQQIAWGHGTGTTSEFVPLESDRIRVWLVSKAGERIEAFNAVISANELLISFDEGICKGLYDIEIFVYRANGTRLHCRLEKRIHIVPTTDKMGIEVDTIQLTGAVLLVIDGVSLQWDDTPTIGSGAVVTSNGIAEAFNNFIGNDREYNSQENTKGYVILRNDKTLAEQLTQANTIYEVRYNFDLDGDTLTIPEGSVLKFNGGCFKNGVLYGNNLNIVADGIKIFENVTLVGKWVCDNYLTEWFGAVGDGITDDTQAIQDTINNVHNVGGGSVKFISESYMITHGKVTLQDNITLYSDRISKITTSTHTEKDLYSYIFGTPADSITNESITIDGLWFDQSQDTYRDMNVTGSRPLYFHDVAYLTVKNCRFNMFGANAIGVFANKSHHIRIYHNYIECLPNPDGETSFFDRSCIYVQGDYVEISDNTCTENNEVSSDRLKTQGGIEVHGCNVECRHNILYGFVNAINITPRRGYDDMDEDKGVLITNNIAKADTFVCLWLQYDSSSTSEIPVEMRNYRIIGNNAICYHPIYAIRNSKMVGTLNDFIVKDNIFKGIIPDSADSLTTGDDFWKIRAGVYFRPLNTIKNLLFENNIFTDFAANCLYFDSSYSSDNYSASYDNLCIINNKFLNCWKLPLSNYTNIYESNSYVYLINFIGSNYTNCKLADNVFSIADSIECAGRAFESTKVGFVISNNKSLDGKYYIPRENKHLCPITDNTVCEIGDFVTGDAEHYHSSFTTRGRYKADTTSHYTATYNISAFASLVLDKKIDSSNTITDASSDDFVVGDRTSFSYDGGSVSSNYIVVAKKGNTLFLIASTNLATLISHTFSVDNLKINVAAKNYIRPKVYPINDHNSITSSAKTGEIVLDSTNGQMYYRSDGIWKYLGDARPENVTLTRASLPSINTLIHDGIHLFNTTLNRTFVVVNRQWVDAMDGVSSDVLRTGTTAQRPTNGIYAGFQYFDTTLSKPIWFDGNSSWVDATGATV